MNIEDQIRELGALIYKERAQYAGRPYIEGNDDHRRVQQLDLAAKWNAIALQGVSKDAR